MEWRLDHGAEVVTIEADDVLVVAKLDGLARSGMANDAAVCIVREAAAIVGMLGLE